MFEADADMSKLKYLPGIDDMTERYRTHVQGVAELYRTAGLANASKKEEQASRSKSAVKVGGQFRGQSHRQTRGRNAR